MTAWKDRVKQTVSAGGTGALTLSTASSGYQALGAGDDGLLYPYVIEDGATWETGLGTYTHSGTSFARTRRYASSTGSALTVTTAALLFVDLNAAFAASFDQVTQAHISGLIVQKGSGNTLDIGAGSCFDPSSSKVLSYGGATSVSAGSLGASQWNQVYIYDNAGTSTIEVVNNTDPPSTTYAGNARQGGTNSNRRWIGCFLTDGSSNIRPFRSNEGAGSQVSVQFEEDAANAPHRVLSAGSATSFTQVSCVGIAPRYVVVDVFASIYMTALPAGSGVDLSTDGATINIGSPQSPASSSGFNASIAWIPVERSTPSVYYKVSSGTWSSYIDITMFRFTR